MKRRKSLILLFILAFTGVALMSHPQVWAAYDVLDRACDDPNELTDKVCAEHRDPDTNQVIFVTQIYVDDTTYSPTIGIASTPSSTGYWPIPHFTDEVLTSLTWKYSIVAAVPSPEDCRSVPGGNFVYWELLGPLPAILDSVPTGANLLKDWVKNCNLVFGPYIERLKLNPEFQCKYDKKTEKWFRVVFSITTEVTGIDERCANFALVNRDGCLVASLLGPGGGAGTGFSGGQTLYCGGNIINVRLDECNQLIEEVTMSEADYVCHATVGDPDHAWFHVKDSKGEDRHAFPSRSAGPRATGFLLCLEPPDETPDSVDDLIDGPGSAWPTDVLLQGDNTWYGVRVPPDGPPPYPAPKCVEQ